MPNVAVRADDPLVCPERSTVLEGAHDRRTNALAGVLGVLVGAIVISMYLPMFKLLTLIKKVVWADIERVVRTFTCRWR